MTLLQYVSAAPFKMCVLGEGDFEAGGVNYFYYLPFIRFFSQKLRGCMLSTTVTHPQGSHIRPLCIALVFGLDTNVILYLVNCISYFDGHAYMQVCLLKLCLSCKTAAAMFLPFLLPCYA